MTLLVVQAKFENESNPSLLSIGSYYFEYPIQVDKGQLGKLEQSPTGTTTP